MIIGRFAPSPTGRLHIGNLRTALAAHGSARADGGRFIIRFEDLDRMTSSPVHALSQVEDLESIGVQSDSEPLFQSDRFDIYEDAIKTLESRGLTFDCFCSRREIREAAAAPHDGHTIYPGTCRNLTRAEREERSQSRAPALRLDGQGASKQFMDRLQGMVIGPVDDIVLRRNDGVPAYNLAVVVDDAAQGITEVVRGDDLMSITASQVALQELLGLPTVVYGHVPLVVGTDGERLAKRHGAITLGDLAERGVSADEVREMLWASLGQSTSTFCWDDVPRETWEFHT